MLGFMAEFSARRTLEGLQDRIGRPGLAAAATVPGLTAAVDQHAAAVRDILVGGVEGSATAAGVILLAGYARGLLDHAREPVEAPAMLAGWARVNWVTTRLLAVCDMARRADQPLAGWPPAI
jgi:hypothetical protein